MTMIDTADSRFAKREEDGSIRWERSSRLPANVIALAGQYERIFGKD